MVIFAWGDGVRVDLALKDFLAACRLREMSSGTIRGYGYDLGRLVRFLEAEGVTAVEDVRPLHLRAFLASVDVGASARARYRASMRTFFRHLGTDGLLTRDPSLAVPRVTLPHYLPRPVAAERIGRILAALEDEDWRVLFTLVAETGMRIAEALHLRCEDVHLEEGTVRVLGKGGKERVIPLVLAERSLGLLFGHLGNRCDGTYVFAGEGGNARTYQQARSAWSRACGKAGEPGIHIHQLRHSFATALVAAEVPIISVQKLLGHASVDTTLRYAALSDAIVRQDLVRARSRVAPLAGRPADRGRDAASDGVGRTPDGCLPG